MKIVNCEDSLNAFQEIHSLKKRNHPNIVKLFEVITTDYQVYLFMICLWRDITWLHRIVWPSVREGSSSPILSNTLSRPWLSSNIVYRDIQPENILLDTGLNVNLADFGLSRVFTKEKLTTFCGTTHYMAPDLVLFKPYKGRKVDVWSMGVVLYRMRTREFPFVGKTLEELTEYILSGCFFIPYFLSEQCHKLLRKW